MYQNEEERIRAILFGIPPKSVLDKLYKEEEERKKNYISLYTRFINWFRNWRKK